MIHASPPKLVPPPLRPGSELVRVGSGKLSTCSTCPAATVYRASRSNGYTMGPWVSATVTWNSVGSWPALSIVRFTRLRQPPGPQGPEELSETLAAACDAGGKKAIEIGRGDYPSPYP